MITLPISNEFIYRSLERNKDLNLNITNTCNVPEKSLLIDSKGNCFLCACESWLPISVGNILDFDNLSGIWATPIAKAIIQDVSDKKFSHCAVTKCGIALKNNNILRNKFFISVNIDESCNVQCPSCRKNKIMHTSGPEFDLKSKQIYHLLGLIQDTKEDMHLTLTGNGDPLASNILRPLLHEYTPLANQTIKLMTNGLLMQKQLANNKIVNNITEYQISVDAGTKEVYEKVRLGSKWDVLKQNLIFLREIVNKTNAAVALTFTLQNDNYKDLKEFADLCKKFNFVGNISLLEDWYTWANYAEHDVIGNRLHPNHNDAISMLQYAYKNLQSPNFKFCSDIITVLNKLRPV